MALGSITKAYETFKKHDFSRSFQLRILDVGSGVPSYVRDELISQDGRSYATSYKVPGRSVENINVAYQGFKFNLPGQVVYQTQPWDITFNTPGDYLVRNALERWSFETSNDETSCGKFHMPCESSSITIAVLSPKCQVLRTYDLIGVYIQNVSEIAYNQAETAGTTFTAAFHYQYWRPGGGNDSGLNDSGAVNNQTIDNTYQTLESKIKQSNSNCPVGIN